MTLIFPESVVIIDDIIDESLPIASAFWHEGIGVKMYLGTPDSLPKSPLVGVRVAIIDLILGVDSVDPKVVFSKLFDVLNSVLSPENGPFIMITWARDKQLSEIFRTLMSLYVNEADVGEEEEEYIRLIKNLTIPKPIFVFEIVKGRFLHCKKPEDFHFGGKKNDEIIQEVLTYLTLHEGFDLEGFVKETTNQYKTIGPCNILINWENDIREASRSTLFELSQLGLQSSKIDQLPFDSDDLQEKWKLSMDRVLAAISRETGLRKEKDWQEITRYAKTGLVPFMIDQLEQRLQDVPKYLEISARRVTKVNQNSDREKVFREAFAGRLNGLLHCDLPKGNTVAPGNVYSCDDIKKIVKDYCKKGDERSIEDEIIANSFDPRKEAYSLNSIKKYSTVVFMEFTAYCDYLQNKMMSTKLIGGVIIPFNKRNKIKLKSDFIRAFGPFQNGRIDMLNDDKMIALNSHYITGTTNNSLREITPQFRLRKEILSSFQSWIGAHIARQGALVVNVPDIEDE